MAPPRRLTYSILETAARWNCSPADIMDWSINGQIEICCILPYRLTTEGPLSGLVAIPAEDVAHMFRRDGMGRTNATIIRCRKRGDAEDWPHILGDQEAFSVGPFDIIIAADSIEKFETEYEMGPRGRGTYVGSSAKWDWEGFYQALLSRVFKQGLPEQQKDLVDEMTGWFERRSPTGETPDVSTIRKKVASVWRELQAD